MRVKITCPKDHLIQQVCTDEFKKKFERFLREKRWHPSDALKAMRWCLAQEAYRQEWYDFTIESGVRKVIRNADGSPQLLVPEVQILDIPEGLTV